MYKIFLLKQIYLPQAIFTWGKSTKVKLKEETLSPELHKHSKLNLHQVAIYKGKEHTIEMLQNSLKSSQQVFKHCAFIWDLFVKCQCWFLIRGKDE